MPTEGQDCERNQAERLLVLEKELHKEGYKFIAGVDEAGRGPLAGPVVAAACILPEDFILPGLDDSKKLSEKKREYLAEKIMEQAVAYSLGSASHEEIDRLNILNATKLAMKRSLDGLEVPPSYVLVDGRDRLEIPQPHKAVIDGDALVACIAAASILAKVARDKLMTEMHLFFPQYAFDQNKGYCTKLHLEALAEHGPCPIHRKSFSPVKEMVS